MVAAVWATMISLTMMTRLPINAGIQIKKAITPHLRGDFLRIKDAFLKKER